MIATGAYPAFYEQPVRSSAVQTFSLGQTFNFDINRDSVVDEVFIVLEGTITTAAATAAIEGLAALVQSVQVRGSMAGVGEIVPVSNASGPDLAELYQFQVGALVNETGQGALGSTGFFRVIIPVRFAQQFWGNEIANRCTSLAAYAMSSLSLSITSATQAQVDTNASATFVLGTTVCWLRIFQCFRDSVPANFMDTNIRTSIEVKENAAVTTQAPASDSLPAGGDYSLILLRAFSAGGASQTKQALSGTAPFTNGATQSIKLYDLTRYIKADISFNDLRASNLQDVFDTIPTGNACFIYNRGPTKLFQTGAINKAQSDIRLEYTATAPSAGGKIRFVYQRIFDPNNVLGIPRKA